MAPLLINTSMKFLVKILHGIRDIALIKIIIQKKQRGITNIEECAWLWDIHIHFAVLDYTTGRIKVDVLLSNMEIEFVKIYDSFAWSPAVVADVDAGIATVRAEDKNDFITVFDKFDRQSGVHYYRKIKSFLTQTVVTCP
ncbi:hypothetical protein DPMN_121957 [Dreissena polymorpha]|uniref:Uncharacterized protein n=1 Tax=Dreissena polymorpha TaxID=45954 RepID=A0A9D4GR15_DREPO|nr:hypothetical protein DPMN_121957 [Dreissena polymorpha]